jgi:hypothetical protein
MVDSTPTHAAHGTPTHTPTPPTHTPTPPTHAPTPTPRYLQPERQNIQLALSSVTYM